MKLQRILQKVTLLAGLMLAGSASADEGKCRNSACPINYKPVAEQSVEENNRVKYAILVNSDHSQRHRYNLGNAYKTLKKIGFNEDNIYVLSILIGSVTKIKQMRVQKSIIVQEIKRSVARVPPRDMAIHLLNSIQKKPTF